jgi:hypothetical protein
VPKKNPADMRIADRGAPIRTSQTAGVCCASRLRKNAKICHSEPRLFFERGEGSAFSLVFLLTADLSPANDAGSG